MNRGSYEGIDGPEHAHNTSIQPPNYIYTSVSNASTPHSSITSPKKRIASGRVAHVLPAGPLRVYHWDTAWDALVLGRAWDGDLLGLVGGGRGAAGRGRLLCLHHRLGKGLSCRIPGGRRRRLGRGHRALQRGRLGRRLAHPERPGVLPDGCLRLGHGLGGLRSAGGGVRAARDALMPRGLGVCRAGLRGAVARGGSAAAGGGDIHPEEVVGAPSTPISLEASRRGLQG